MKIITASDKQTIKMSKSEWLQIGKKVGWAKFAQFGELEQPEQATSQPEQPKQENPLKGAIEKVIPILSKINKLTGNMPELQKSAAQLSKELAAATVILQHDRSPNFQEVKKVLFGNNGYLARLLNALASSEYLQAQAASSAIQTNIREAYQQLKAFHNSTFGV